MSEVEKYQVLWDCPHCGNSHTWWWEDKCEAFDEGETNMVCDRCDALVKCKGDGNGFYEPVKESTPFPGSFGEKLQDLEKKCDELLDLNTDVHNYVRGLEDKVNQNNQVLHNAVNALGKRLVGFEAALSAQVGQYERMNDNLARRTTEAELAIYRLEEGIKPGKSAKPAVSAIDLIHGVKQPFHERFREGCQFTRDQLPPDKLASILLFISVEVERMTERDMGGSFSISNLKVAQQLRELATEASIEDYIYGSPDHEEGEGDGGDLQVGDCYVKEEDPGVLYVYDGNDWLTVNHSWTQLAKREDELP